MTEDLQQQSVWCLSGCFSPVNTSKQVSAKLSDSWVTLHRSEPTHRWQQPGQELRPQGNYTAGRAVCVRNAELKGSSSRYCRFPRKGSKYQKHETREKGSERQELHPAEWEACCRVQNQSRELEGQGGVSIHKPQVNEKVKCDLGSSYPPIPVRFFFHKTVNHLHFSSQRQDCCVRLLVC